MASYTNFYLINQYKSNLKEAEQSSCFLTIDFKFLWKVCKDFITTIDVECYIYINNNFLYDFRNLNDNRLLSLYSLQMDNPHFGKKDY